MGNVAVVGLSYGDEGKGTVVNRLCASSSVDVVVRFNGGCQAAHSVVTDDGRHHTFAQFGSGTFQGAATYLAEPVMVEPLSMMIEMRALDQLLNWNPLSMMHVDPRCRLTTPYHWLVNRWREDRRARREGRHGSCGRGIGATAEFALAMPEWAPTVADIQDPDTLYEKLIVLGAWAVNETKGETIGSEPYRPDLVKDYQDWLRHVTLLEGFNPAGLEVVYEGAQGVLLDEHAGFHPHTTWSTVTPDWVREHDPEAHIVGVTRTYMTRHGAGPFVTEDNSLNFPEPHNKREHYQGAWRVGHFDTVAMNYAIQCAGGVDSLYVTHADSALAEPRLKVCTAYEGINDLWENEIISPWTLELREQQTRELMYDARPVYEEIPDRYDWPHQIARMLRVPLSGIGTGTRTSDNDVLADTGLVP